jgi:hypothetical protein
LRIEGWLGVVAIAMSGYQLLLWRDQRKSYIPPYAWRVLDYLDVEVSRLLGEPRIEPTTWHSAFRALAVAARTAGQSSVKRTLNELVDEMEPLAYLNETLPPIAHEDLKKLQVALRSALLTVREREM